MVLFPSIMTILCALESPSLLMDSPATFSSILLTQATTKDSTRHSFLQAGTGASKIFSMSSCQRFVHFPSWSFIVDPSFYAEHASFGEPGIQKALLGRPCVEARVQNGKILSVVLPGCCGQARVERCRSR